MKPCFYFLTLLFSVTAFSQNRFDSLQAAKHLLTLPKSASKVAPDKNIVRAIETVDKHFRVIADSLFGHQSLKHTIFQTVMIETNDSVYINPIQLGDKIPFTNIIFYNRGLNAKVDSISKTLPNAERKKFYKYLLENFDNFSMREKRLDPQPVRLQYIMFPDDKFVHIGIDIYGSHFLWTVEKSKNWEVIKVENLWVY